MEKKQLEILREFADKIRRRYPGARIWAFGSRARGDETVDSDLDICVVLPQMQADDRIEVSDIAWEVSLDHDLHLSTVVVSEENFEKGPAAESPFLQTIQKEGVAA